MKTIINHRVEDSGLLEYAASVMKREAGSFCEKSEMFD
jgi:hypothetical protein